MCRWVAYAGPEIYLEDILFNQDHSIVNQSLSAHESVWTTNGDGFGVSWYTQRTTAGLFKDVLPAWNDSNLRSPSLQVGPPHTRASEQIPNEFNSIASEPSNHQAEHRHHIDEGACVHWTRERMNFYPIEPV